MDKKKKNNKKKLVRLSAMLLTAAIIDPAPAPAQTLSCPQSLLFGDYSTCASTETATITPANTRTTTGCLTTGGAPISRAQCNVVQTFPFTNIVISVTATQYNITNTTTATMKVDNFSCRFQPSASTTVTGACSFSFTSAFFMLMDIGADLTVANGQAPGTYSGTFTVNTNFP